MTMRLQGWEPPPVCPRAPTPGVAVLARSACNAMGLSIFDGDNLENRIMMLTKKTLSLSRTAVIGLALAIGITFGAGAVLAHAMSLQAGSEPSNTAEKFAGTWHWMFDGRSFATDGAGSEADPGLTGPLQVSNRAG